MFSLLLLSACGLDLDALLAACDSPPDTGNPSDDPAQGGLDDEDLDGPIVDTDSDAMILSIEGIDYVATSVIIVPIEGDPINVPSAISLTASTGGTLALSDFCCDANGEDLSLELLSYQTTGNSSAALSDAGELEVSGLENAQRDGVTFSARDMQGLFSFEARTTSSEVWNQPLVTFGSSGNGVDGVAQSIIGITIELGVTTGNELEWDVAAGVLTTGLGTAFDTCGVELRDERGTVASWEGACDAVRFPIDIVPMEGATDAVIGFAVRSGERVENPRRSSIEYELSLEAREAGSGLAAGE